MNRDVTAVIVAGGAGRRMGGAVKALIEIDGATIVERQLAVLRPRCTGVVIAVGPGADAAWAPAGATVVRDAVPDGGPLAGIAAGLAAATTPWVLAVAGDMPWLAGGVLDLIVRELGAALAVVPRVGGYPEPLCAAYHARARASIDAAIARGERSPSRWLGGCSDIHWIDEPALRAVDASLRTFASVNTADDLR